MKRTCIRIVFVLLAAALYLRFLHFFAPSPPPPSPATYTANSCTYADVNDCINGSGVNTCHLPNGGTGTHTAINGDTVLIPAGDCSTTNNYTSTLHITVAINLIGGDLTNKNLGACLNGNTDPNCGSGIGNSSSGTTILGDNVDKSGCHNNPMIFLDNEAQGNVPWTISNLMIRGVTTSDNGQGCASHIRIQTGSHAWRMHDVTFDQLTDEAVIIDGDHQGVADHNTATGTGANPTGHQLIFNCRESHWGEVDAADTGNNSWATADNFSSGQGCFFENNSFFVTIPSGDGNVNCEYGARCIIRYNVMQNCTTHGTDTSQIHRGVRWMIFYNNYISDQGATNTGSFCQQRSGTTIFVNNTLHNPKTGNYANLLELANYRRAGGTCPWGPNSSPWTLLCAIPGGTGGIWGNGPYDLNHTGSTGSGCNSTGMDANGNSIYACGTATSGSSTDSLADSSINCANVPAGAAVLNLTNSANPNHPWGSDVLTCTTGTGLTTDSAAQGPNHQWSSGDTYWIMLATAGLDMTGYGKGTLINNDNASIPPQPVGWPSEVITPIYAAGNQICNPGCSYTDGVGTKFGLVTANEHYFDHNLSWTPGTTCSSGTCYGTHAQRLAISGANNLAGSSVPGTGFWETDNNLLYVWLNSAWTLWWQPYTYPHPLVTNTIAPGTTMMAKK